MSTTHWLRGSMGALVIVLVALSGCVEGSRNVAVAGYDANGTLVVGATSCPSGGESGPDRPNFWVRHAGGDRDALLWVAETRREWDREQESVDPGPARAGVRPPEPPSLSEVRLVPVGDPDPRDLLTIVALSGPVPETGTFEVEVALGQAEPVDARLTVGATPVEDRYSAVLDGTVVRDLDGAELSRRIEEECTPNPLAIGPLGVVALVLTVGLALGGAALIALLVGIGMLVVRANRRTPRPSTRPRRRTGDGRRALGTFGRMHRRAGSSSSTDR